MRRSAAVLFVSLLTLAACSSSSPSTSPSTPAGGEPEGTKTYPNLERTHVDTPVDYPQKPPVGGPHNSVWQTCAFYSLPIISEHGVHSLEHGAVWLTFQPDLPSAQVGKLKKFVKGGGGGKVLVSPFPGLPTPVVASGWGTQLQLQSADDPRLAQFVAYFADGPQTPEPGATCDGGTTETAN